MVASRRAMPQKPATLGEGEPGADRAAEQEKAAVNGIAQQHPQ